MGNMGIGHNKVVIPDSCNFIATDRCAVNCYIFTDDIITANFYFRLFAFVSDVLRRKANRSKGKYSAVAAYFRFFDNNMRFLPTLTLFPMML
jgi:hypothetical protein